MNKYVGDVQYVGGVRVKYFQLFEEKEIEMFCTKLEIFRTFIEPSF